MQPPSVATSLAPIVSFVQPWQTLYADHSSVSTLVLFVHLGALVMSAGLAVVNDRAIVRTTIEDVEGRTRRLADLSVSHRSVLAALLVSFASGVLLFLADVEAFVGMPAFWVKMLLITTLAANARLMMRQESHLRILSASPVPPAASVTTRLWTRLRRHAFTSLVLWFAIVLAGTAMTSG